MDNNKVIKVYTTSNGAELNISAPSTKQLISATNNRAQYFAEQAQKFRDEAKIHRDNAKFYAEQNSNVTFEQINNLKNALEEKIATKQDVGNYALKEELPINVSELQNDANYVVKSDFDNAVDDLKLPAQEGCDGKFLMSNGENEAWVGISTFQLFDTKISDNGLTFEKSKGWALQGTYVYKDAIAGSHYGYPDFYNQCIKEFNEATTTETVNGVTVKVHSNGHKFYDIANKDAIDSFFNATGFAWFYGVDTANERIFLPRDKQLMEQTTTVDYSSPTEVSITNGIYIAPSDGYLIANRWGTSNTTKLIIRAGSDTGNEIYTVATGEYPGRGHSCFLPLKKGEKIHITVVGTYYIKFYPQTKSYKDNGKFLYICVGNTVNYEGLSSVVNQGMEILEQVAQKVNVDGTNLNAEGKSLISGYAMPSGRYIDLALGAHGTTYTAPANGWFYAYTVATSQYSFLAWERQDTKMQMHIPSANNAYGCGVYIPVRKNDEVNLYYGNKRFEFLRFIYAEGEV